MTRPYRYPTYARAAVEPACIAFERANPHLEPTPPMYVSLGGLLLERPAHRRDWPFGYVGRAIDHTACYWDAHRRRYALVSQPGAVLPQCEDPDDGCGCLAQLRRQVAQVNERHRASRGDDNGEELRMYVRPAPFAWYHDQVILVVLASSIVPVNLDYAPPRGGTTLADLNAAGALVGAGAIR